MLIADLHCDLPYKALSENKHLSENGCHWDYKQLNKNEQYLQIFANYIDKLETDNPFLTADKMINKFTGLLSKYQSIKLAKNKSDLISGINNKKTVALLSIEGGEALGGNINNLYYFYEKGVRILTLTWNMPNELGDGVGEYSKLRGLTEFGKQVVREMNKINMIVDVSHLSEKGFCDVAEESEKSFIASHSNSYSVCPHKRNLKNEQFLEIAKRQGLVGINLYPLFINGTNSAKIDDIFKHIEHFLALDGENVLALGCDFDGVDCLPDDIGGISDLTKLAEYMMKMNYSDDLIKKIMGKNAINYFIRELI